MSKVTRHYLVGLITLFMWGLIQVMLIVAFPEVMSAYFLNGGDSIYILPILVVVPFLAVLGVYISLTE